MLTANFQLHHIRQQSLKGLQTHDRCCGTSLLMHWSLLVTLSQVINQP